MKTSNISIALMLCVLAVNAASCITEIARPTENVQLSSHNHTLEKTQKVKLIWSANNVYIVWNKFDTTLSAGTGQVCFLGGPSLHQDKFLTCLDGQNGELLWKIESGIHRALEVTPDGVFVIYSSSAGVKKYDRSTGNIEWSRLLGGSGCYYFYIVDNELQISINPTNLEILDLNGNFLRRDVNTNTITYISTSDETYIRLNGLVTTSTETGKIRWEFRDMDNLFDFMPFFWDDKIFVRTGLQIGSVYALDRRSGNLLWETSGIISNVVYSAPQHSIYALREDGNLVAFEDETGNEQVIARFTSVPFILAGDENVGSYQIAYDENAAMLFLSLGDSGQLFAFKEQ
ncbi:MAG: PQQ-like beta-propeller repeat protein [Anaerolineales bacterium]|nr:PQQ-like beta-propeller repeat protein [Anaerolineales bacterium]